MKLQKGNKLELFYTKTSFFQKKIKIIFDNIYIYIVKIFLASAKNTNRKGSVMTFEMIFTAAWVVVPIALWVIYFTPEEWYKLVRGKTFPSIAIYMIALVIMSVAFQDIGAIGLALLVTIGLAVAVGIAAMTDGMEEEEIKEVFSLLLPTMATAIFFIAVLGTWIPSDSDETAPTPEQTEQVEQ